MSDQNSTTLNRREAWAAVIDFDKTVISIASGVLTAFSGYVFINHLEFSFAVLAALFFLAASIICAIFGFGRALTAIRDSTEIQTGISFSNVAPYLLFFGLIAALFSRQERKDTIDFVLKQVEATTQSFQVRLSPDACSEISVKDRIITLTYSADGEIVTVNYSVDSQQIINITSQKFTGGNDFVK